MAADFHVLPFYNRYDLEQFVKGVCSGADPHKATSIRYFVCNNIYDTAFIQYPRKGWQRFVDCLCLVVDKCDGLQALQIHCGDFNSVEEVEAMGSTIKELAGQVLGHHSNLTQLIQYGPVQFGGDVWHTNWALVDKNFNGLESWASLKDCRIVSEYKDLSQGGKRLPIALEQKRDRDWMMSEMGGSYKDDLDSSDGDEDDDREDADEEGTSANGDGADNDSDTIANDSSETEPETDDNDEEDADEEGADADGDGEVNDSDNDDDNDSSEREPEADDDDEAEHLREDGNHADQTADQMDETATRIKRRRLEY